MLSVASATATAAAAAAAVSLALFALVHANDTAVNLHGQKRDNPGEKLLSPYLIVYFA